MVKNTLLATAGLPHVTIEQLLEPDSPGAIMRSPLGTLFWTTILPVSYMFEDQIGVVSVVLRDWLQGEIHDRTSKRLRLPRAAP